MSFAITSVVHGYHVYKDIWEAEISSELPCSPEPDNHKDCYAVVVFGCLEAASTASLAALIVAKGSVSDIMDLLDLADF